MDYIAFINNKDIIIANGNDEYGFGKKLENKIIERVKKSKKKFTGFYIFDDSSYLMTLMPIIGYDNKIHGLVASGIDIKKLLKESSVKLNIAINFNSSYFKIDNYTDKMKDWDKAEFKYSIENGNSTFTILENNLKEKSTLENLFNKTIFIMLLTIVLFVLISLFLTKIVTNSIYALIEDMKRYSKGDKKINKIEKSKDEIGKIIDTYQLLKEENISLVENLEHKIEKRTKELEKATEKAQLASKSKSEFLANMSHEIRTPMNSVIGFSDLLAKIIKDPIQKDYLHSIQTGGKALLTIINDILDLSKIEAGKFQIEKTSVEPMALFNDIKTIFSSKIEQKNLTFILEVDEDIPNAIMIDAVRVRQILINLIGNSIKFTQNGTITLKIESVFKNEMRSKLDLRILVKDTGRGIAKENQKKIFGAFEQTSADDAKVHAGTGLGLAICAKLTKLMDGEINVESKLNEGSTFSVVLHNIAVRSIDDVSREDDSDDMENLIFEHANILIVDDIAENRKLVKSALGDFNFSFIEAKNGQEALDIVFSDNKIDVIFMDLRMPIMSGYEATSKIKESDKKDIAIIALTASVMGKDFEKMKEYHFDDYLRKPVIFKELVKSLCKFISYERTESENEKHIIVIDKNSIENIPKVLKLLEDDFKIELDNIKDKGDFSLIQTFMEKVQNLGSENSLSIIEQYAEKTLLAIESFDIEKVNKMIFQYDIICQKLKDFYKDGING